PPSPPFQYGTGHASFRQFTASDGGKSAQKLVFRSFDKHLALGDLDALREGAQVVTAVAATVEPHPLAGRGRESRNHLRCDRLMGRTVEHGLRTLGIGLGLVTQRAQALDAVFQRRVVEVGYAGLYGVVEAFQA